MFRASRPTFVLVRDFVMIDLGDMGRSTTTRTDAKGMGDDSTVSSLKELSVSIREIRSVT